MGDELLIGAQYFRAPTPLPEEWEGDLDLARELGLDFVQLRVHWRHHESRNGEYDFSELDDLFSLAEARGLRVVVQVVMESAPDYVFRELGGTRLDLRGLPILPGAVGAFYTGGWEPCFDNPHVREAGGRFIRALVERCARRPSLLYYDCWNEPRSRPRGACWCKHSRASFREFLAREFGSIEALNEKFALSYETFEDIPPPTMPESWVEHVLFTRWKAHSVADRVKWAAGAIRRADPSHPVMTHVGICSPLQDVLSDVSYDPQNSETVDFYGTSLPHWTGEFRSYFDIDGEAVLHNPDWRAHMYVIPLACDWARSVCEDYWASELYVNTWHSTSPDMTPENLRLWLWEAVARGAGGVCLWQFRSERLLNETQNQGLVNVAGELTLRGEEVRRQLEVVSRLGAFVERFRPKAAEVGIVYDLESDILGRLEDTNASNLDANFVSYRYKQALKGTYACLWRLGAAVEFIPSEGLAERLEGKKLLFFPVTPRARPEWADALKRFVAAEGVVVADVDFASRDERLWRAKTVPSPPFDELFRARQLFAKRVSGERIAVRGRRINAQGLLAELVSEGAKPVGTGERACVATQEGRAFLLGFSPGLTYFRSRDGGVEALFSFFLREAEVSLKVRSEGMVSSVEGKDGGLVVLNYEPEETTFHVSGSFESIHGAVPVEDRAFKLPPREVGVLQPRLKLPG